MKWLTRSIVPSMAALAALIAFLPRTGPAVGLTTSDFQFAPQGVQVRAGDSITIRNDGEVTHTFDCPECRASTGNIQPGQAKIVRLPKEGTFDFFCLYHADDGMRGRIMVVDSAASSFPTVWPMP